MCTMCMKWYVSGVRQEGCHTGATVHYNVPWNDKNISIEEQRNRFTRLTDINNRFPPGVTTR